MSIKRVKPTSLSESLSNQLTVSQLKRLQSEGLQKSLETNLEAEERARLESEKIYVDFSIQLESILNRAIKESVEDSIGNIDVCIPVEKIDEMKENLRGLLEDTIAIMMNLVGPLDSTLYFDMVSSRINSISVSNKTRLEVMDSCDYKKMRSDNPADYEHYYSLYARGCSDTISRLRDELVKIREDIKKRNELLTGFQKQSKITL